LLDDGCILSWHRNGHYQKVDLIEKEPGDYSELGIDQQISIYSQYEENTDLFLFIPNPAMQESLWKRFKP